MRLTCPNCNAQYEVDETVIPQAGRDVQCSACGHTWYQYPLEVALRMRAADLEDEEDEDEDAAAPPPADGTRRAGAPRIDKTVLDVLREEAEREMAERRRGRAGIETQEELGLARRVQPSRAAPSRIYGEPDPEAPPPPAEPEPEAGSEDHEASAGASRASRRSLLPDIEELTSTLEPGAQTRTDEGEEAEDDDRRGFRAGFSTVLLIAMGLAAVYFLAPVIEAYVPAVAGPVQGYVATIDSLRALITEQIHALIGA